MRHKQHVLLQVLLKKTKTFYTNFNLFGAVSIANPDNIIVDENHNSILFYLQRIADDDIKLMRKIETYFCNH